MLIFAMFSYGPPEESYGAPAPSYGSPGHSYSRSVSITLTSLKYRGLSGGKYENHVITGGGKKRNFYKFYFY